MNSGIIVMNSDVGGDWNMTGIIFPSELRISSSQLTNSYFSEGLKPPTSVLFGAVSSEELDRN